MAVRISHLVVEIMYKASTTPPTPPSQGSRYGPKVWMS